METQEFVRAHWILRVVAFFIDHMFILSGIMVVFFMIAGSNMSNEENFDQVMTTMKWLFIPIIIIYLCKDLFGGLSFGRWMVGIAVRDKSNHAKVPSPIRLIIRNVSLPIWPLELLLMVVSPNNTRFGDWLANTSVILYPKKVPALYKVIVILLCVIFFGSFFFVSILSMIKQSEPYQLAISHIETNDDVTIHIGDVLSYGALPLGGVQTVNGMGYADFSIRVYGKEGEMVVEIQLEKQPGSEWEVTEMEIQ